MSRMKLQHRPFDTPFMSSLARDVDHLQSSIQKMFENPLGAIGEPLPLPSPSLVAWYPPVEVAESESEITMTAELPGMDQKDVRLEVDGDVLTLHGEKRSTRVEEGKGREYFIEERSYGAFRRTFTLPPSVDTGKITALFDKGVLTLRMPKDNEAKPRGREIPIGAAPAPAPPPAK